MSRSTVHSVTSLATASVLLLVLLAACGDGEEDSSDSAPSGGTSTPAAAATSESPNPTAGATSEATIGGEGGDACDGVMISLISHRIPFPVQLSNESPSFEVTVEVVAPPSATDARVFTSISPSDSRRLVDAADILQRFPDASVREDGRYSGSMSAGLGGRFEPSGEPQTITFPAALKTADAYGALYEHAGWRWDAFYEPPFTAESLSRLWVTFTDDGMIYTWSQQVTGGATTGRPNCSSRAAPEVRAAPSGGPTATAEASATGTPEASATATTPASPTATAEASATGTPEASATATAEASAGSPAAPPSALALTWNPDVRALQDPRVRQAISLASDLPVHWTPDDASQSANGSVSTRKKQRSCWRRLDTTPACHSPSELRATTRNSGAPPNGCARASKQRSLAQRSA